MHFFERIRFIKLLLIVVAVVIAIASLLTSDYLIRDLQQEERNKMEVWAEAMRSLNDADEYTDLNLVLKVINGNNTIPVIVVDNQGNVQTHRNLSISFKSDADSMLVLRREAEIMKNKGNSIRIFPNTPYYASPESETDSLVADSVVVPQATEVPDDIEFIEICYDESLMLRRLAVYPYLQLSVVVIFVLIAIFALFSSMKAEQNKVWVGLSKETAHQLGTPISSLMAWSAVLRENYPDDEFLPEMEKDIKRLERIAERFSKIGSIPNARPEDICEVVMRVVEYMEHRTSNKVKITTHLPEEPVVVQLIASLFEWVLENLCKNAVDAMGGSGSIDIKLEEQGEEIIVEVKDTGKGMPKSHFSSVFKPGFTTKERGWGLGLSLAKRIVEEYHHGHIFVKSSEIGKGTCFRIELPK